MSPRKTYILKLYVAGNTPNSMRALKTLRNILEEEFRGVYALKVIDVLKNPQLAEEDKILATPTLAKILPPPVRRIIGDLSDRERVLIGLDLLYDELSDETSTDNDDEIITNDSYYDSAGDSGDDLVDDSSGDLVDELAEDLADDSGHDSVDKLAGDSAVDSVNYVASNSVDDMLNNAVNNFADSKGDDNVDNKVDNKAGSKAGSKAGGKPGNKADSKADNKTGGKANNKAGNKLDN